MAATPEPSRIEGLPGILVYLGLGQPTARAFVAGTLAGLVAYTLKWPSQAFEEETNEMRPFKLLSQAPHATYNHFLAVPLTVGTLAFIFT